MALGHSQSLLDTAPDEKPAYLSLGLYSETYKPNSTQPGNQYPSILVGGGYEKRRDKFVMIHGEGELFLNTKEFNARYLNVRELYTSFGTNRNQVAFGRKLESWSSLDTQWRLGLWQPRFRWNYLEPDVVGLTGFYGRAGNDQVQAMIFGTPIYVPELGAQYEFHDGVVTSPNRFVAAPPGEISLLGAATPVRYQVDSTRLTEIIFNPSAGASLRVGGWDGFWAQGAYTYAPVNRLMLGYEGYLYVQRSDVEVTLHPRIFYHHLFGFDAGYTGNRFRAGLSAIVERPVGDGTPAFWTIEQLRPATLVSPSVEFDLTPPPRRIADAPSTGHIQGSTLALSYLWTNGGVTGDEGPLAAPGRSIFESRYPYRSAVRGELGLPVQGDDHRGMRLSSRSIYDFSVGGVLLSLDLRYKHDEHWAVGLGGDAVASGRDAAFNGGADFFYLNRSNDRLRGKVTYVF